MGYPEVDPAPYGAARNKTDAAYQHDVRVTVEGEAKGDVPRPTFTGDDTAED